MKYILCFLLALSLGGCEWYGPYGGDGYRGDGGYGGGYGDGYGGHHDGRGDGGGEHHGSGH